jgi:hypothetical protein
MVLFYNQAYPSNIRQSYPSQSQVDFLLKTSPGRSIQAGTMRLTGRIQVTKSTPQAPSTFVPIEIADRVMINPFCGLHGLVSNVSSSINERVIETISEYPRMVACRKMGTHTLEELTASLKSGSEHCGVGNYMMTATQSCPFAVDLEIAVNRSSQDLGQSKYSQIKVMMILASATQAFYISTEEPQIPAIAQLQFTLTDLELHWTEVPEMKTDIPCVFPVHTLVTQSVVSSNTTLSVTAASAYSAVFASFIKESSRNSIYADSYFSEYIRDIQSVQFTTSGVDLPLTYTIGAGGSPPYQDLCLNALKAVDGDTEKNSICNLLVSQNGAFVIGMKYATSSMDKLQIVLALDSNSDFQISQNPYLATIFIHGFLSL